MNPGSVHYNYRKLSPQSKRNAVVPSTVIIPSSRTPSIRGNRPPPIQRTQQQRSFGVHDTTQPVESNRQVTQPVQAQPAQPVVMPIQSQQPWMLQPGPLGLPRYAFVALAAVIILVVLYYYFIHKAKENPNEEV